MILELVAVAVVAAFIGALLFLRSLDLDSYRDSIAAQIREATGRGVKIQGHLRVELALAPTVAFGGLTVGNAKGSPGPPLLEAQRLELRLRLWPLFSRRLEVESVRLSGARISLETDREGRGNWVFGGSGEGIPKALQSVAVADSTLHYLDQASGWAAAIDVPRVTARREDPSGARFRIQGALRSGSSDLAGTGLVDLGSDPERVEATLHADRFDLSDLTAGGGSSSAGDVWRRRIPFNALRSLDGEVHLDVGAAVFGRIRLEDVATEFRMRGGVLAFDSLKAGFADGRVDGRATIDAAAVPPALAAKLDMQKLDLSRLWREAQVRGVIEGRAMFDADLKAAGDSPSAIFASLSGETTLAMGEGRLLSSVIDRLAPDLLTRIAPWMPAEKSTSVNCAVARFEFQSGRGTSKVLLLDTPRVTFVGSGTIDLASHAVDLGVEPSPKDLEVTRVAVPIRIRGPLASPDAFAAEGGILKGLGDTVFRSLWLPPALMGRLLDLGMAPDNPCVQARSDADVATRAVLEERAARERSRGGFSGFVGGIGERMKGAAGTMKRLFDPRRW